MIWAYNLRVLAIFAVVLLHVSGKFVVTSIHGDFNWWAGNIYDSITRWSVPLFIMISGYFLVNNNENNIEFFKKRLKKIFLPLLFWSVIFSIWSMFKYGSNIYGIIGGILVGRPYYHLWYVYMIPFLYVITPYLKCLIQNEDKKTNIFFIYFCFSISILITLFNFHTSANNPTLFITDFLYYIGYYFLGGYIRKYDLRIKKSIYITIFTLSIITTIFGGYYGSIDYFYNNLSINTILVSISLFLIIKNNMNFNFKIQNISYCSFGIYLIHPIILESFTSFFGDTLLNITNIFIYIPLMSLLVFFTSYFITKLLLKIKIKSNLTLV